MNRKSVLTSIALLLFATVVSINVTACGDDTDDLGIASGIVSGTVYDSGRSVIPDVVVSIGNDTTTTDANGNYVFTNLQPGTYQIEFVLSSLPAGFVVAPQDAGSNDGLDSDGNPTTDPVKGLLGSMAPSGGYKGFGQGLIVEVMCAALTASNRGPQMGSFMANDGKRIGCGQFFIAIEPNLFSGGAFAKQVTALVKSITAQEGARLPNARRTETARRLAKEGLPISKALCSA